MPIAIRLARHATPDWSRKDIPYHVPPGPPLVARGEREALALGRFLRHSRIARVYTSPFERALRTAQIAAGALGLPPIVDAAIGEWRTDETRDMVAARLEPFWRKICAQSEMHGPILAVTHGSPIGFLLSSLGLPSESLAAHQARFDHGNPAPPAGAWSATAPAAGGPWTLNLAFVPGGASSADG